MTEGLLASDRDVEVLYEVLGAVIHLEPLVLEDEQGLDEVNDLVHAWLGPYLRQSWASFLDEVEPYERRHLDYIPGQLTCLEDAAGSVFASYRRENVDGFGVNVNGAAQRANASPFSYRYWMEASDEATHGVLMITVPTGWPLDDFQRNILALLPRLRVRWASIGYTYSTWFVLDYETAARRLRAHAMRHVGFDTGLFIGQGEVFSRAIRTVNWITALGPSLEQRWREATKDDRTVERLGPLALLRTGERPERGDRNRLDYPAGYVELERRLRAVQLQDGIDVDWIGWEERDVTDWLRRFQLRPN